MPSLTAPFAVLASALGAAGHNGPAVRAIRSKVDGIIPADSLTHFCVVTGHDRFEELVGRYSMMLGVEQPETGTTAGPDSNSTYLPNAGKGKPEKMVASSKIVFLELNDQTKMEFLGAEPQYHSWWQDVYLAHGQEIHHMGYALPDGVDIWPVIEKFEAAGLGLATQWGRWGEINKPDSGCYVYMDSQASLGTTLEILGGHSGECDSLPAQPEEAVQV